MILSRHALLHSLTVLLAIAGVANVYILSHQGVGLYGDTVVYFTVARNLKADNLPVNYPPLYPMALAAAARFTCDLESAVKLVNAVSTAVLLVSMVFGLRNCFGPPRYMAVLAGLLVLLSLPVQVNCANAMAESLFLALTAVALVAWSEYSRRERGMPWLLTASAATALAVLTRYAGVPLVAVAGLVVLAKNRLSRATLKEGALMGLISCLPIASLLLWNMARSGKAMGRAVESAWLAGNLSALGPAKLGQFTVTLLEWILPYRMIAPMSPAVMIMLLAVALFLLAWLCVRTAAASRGEYLVLWSWLLCYSLFLFAWIFVAQEVEIALDSRLLAPLILALIPLPLVAAYRFLWLDRRTVLSRALYVSAVVCLVLFHGQRAFAMGQKRYHEGYGYGARAWRDSETMALVRAKHGSVPLYSNAPDAVFLLTGLTVRGLPHTQTMWTMKANPRYADEMGGLARDAREAGALVVFFRLKHPTSGDMPPYLPTLETIMEDAGLVIVETLSDAVILGSATAVGRQ